MFVKTLFYADAIFLYYTERKVFYGVKAIFLTCIHSVQELPLNFHTRNMLKNDKWSFQKFPSKTLSRFNRKFFNRPPLFYIHNIRLPRRPTSIAHK
jgi:hypothetical protein